MHGINTITGLGWLVLERHGKQRSGGLQADHSKVEFRIWDWPIR